MIADSTIEAEHIAASEAAKEAFWYKKFAVEIRVMPSDAIPLYCDKNGAIALAKERGLTKNPSILSGDTTSSAITSRRITSRSRESTPQTMWQTYLQSHWASRRSKSTLRRWDLDL